MCLDECPAFVFFSRNEEISALPPRLIDDWRSMIVDCWRKYIDFAEIGQPKVSGRVREADNGGLRPLRFSFLLQDVGHRDC